MRNNRAKRLHRMAHWINLYADEPRVAQVLRGILVEMLPEQLAHIIRMAQAESEITARMVADTLDISVTAASTVCKELFDLTLLEREERPADHGREFWYWLRD